MDYRVGDVVTYATFTGSFRICTVTEKHEDIKNGRPGFDGTFFNFGSGFEGCWGYDEQIVRVEEGGSV